jgi:hypothetical protein
MTEKTIDLDQRVMAQKANDLRVAIGYVRFTSKESHVMAAALGIWGPVSEAELATPPHAAKIGAGRGMSFASFRRFWAVAANRNSSLAPSNSFSAPAAFRSRSRRALHEMQLAAQWPVMLYHPVRGRSHEQREKTVYESTYTR